jgi:hypothetical protein
MFAGWFRNMVREAINEHAAQPMVRESSQFERMFGNNAPAVVAFKINNGYVVQTIDTSNEVVGGVRSTGFTYCKDNQAIAEHIVASAMKEKMGLQPYQQEMFEKAQSSAKLSTTSRFTNRSL